MSNPRFGDIVARLLTEDEKGFPNGSPHGWIQWKGTDACIDLHCSCGYHGHYDGYFLYFYECPGCKRRWAVGQCVKLIPLLDEEMAIIETAGVDDVFKKGEPD